MRAVAPSSPRDLPSTSSLSSHRQSCEGRLPREHRFGWFGTGNTCAYYRWPAVMVLLGSTSILGPRLADTAQLSVAPFLLRPGPGSLLLFTALSNVFFFSNSQVHLRTMNEGLKTELQERTQQANNTAQW
jgi:hypothetical protein